MPLQKLQRLAKEHGLRIEDKGNGHIQIKGGPCLINYYPFSKRSTAYIAGTMKGQAHATPDTAVQLALGNARVMIISKKGKRKSNKRAKEILWSRRPHVCHWCETELETMESATVDHRIPLCKGGLNHLNNMVLSCEPCNHTKGPRMPTYETTHDLLRAKGLLD